MSIWGARRRAIILLSIILIIVLGTALIAWIVFYDTPTCSDGNKNGDEMGVDCGGSCKQICEASVLQPNILWTRFFETVPGQYNTVAYVENINSEAEARNAEYVLRLVGDNNQVLAERKGSIILKAKSRTPIVENRIFTGENIPSRIEFVAEVKFDKALPQDKMIVVKDEKLVDTEIDPRVTAKLINVDVKTLRDIDVIAIVYNKSGNAIGSSSTFVESIPKNGEVPIFFTWPVGFERDLLSCSAPTDVVVLFDTSGSMNDDGGNPPQPITDAKRAAEEFVSGFGEDDQTGLVVFATNAESVQSLTTDHLLTQTAVKNISILQKEETGFTNTGDAIAAGQEELSKSSRTKRVGGTLLDVRRAMVLLTDGLSNYPRDPGGEPYAEEKAKLAKENGIEIFTIGLGGKLNEEFLSNIASGEDKYYKAGTSKALSGIYSEISGAICESGPGVVEIVPLYDDTN